MTEARLEQQPVSPAEDAAAPASSAPNIVKLPNGHTVTLEPELTIPLGMAAASVLRQGGGEAAIEYGLAQLWIGVHPSGQPFAIRDWDFTDPQGNPEPVTAANIARLLPYGDGGLEVIEAAGLLYGEKVLRPLLARQSARSNNGRTGNGTPQTSGRGSITPMRSKRSSRNGTAGRRSGG